ncbi:rhomboid family intramembrane serine protease [Haloferula sp. A504]|uniref:rhomboid family intramembrane serine protease n=1 Tax=Haloferula sp. A504 TaxID=3373601 RepID=UPI0031BDC2C1|nr:rhomboid family intramembrane serine protease [Verrucomicrobiaceae bacterium E54]
MSRPVIGWKRVLHEQGVLLGLITLLILLFILQLAVGRSGYEPFMCVPAEVTAAWNHLLAGTAGATEAWSLFTLLSCALLHSDIGHLASNLLFLWGFAALVSELLGWRWMLVFFVLAAIGGSITHVALQPDNPIPMLGASGAVSGFMGAYLGLATRFRLPDPHVWPLARPIPPSHLAFFGGIYIAMDYFAIFGGSTELIAFGAHVGGFTTGLLMAGLLVPRPASAR